jgi:hypothetical protein
MGSVVVFEQAPDRRDGSPVQRSVALLADSARLAGLRVVGLPYDFDEATADDALYRLSPHPGAVGFLAGFISPPGYYAALAQAATERGITMINTPAGSRDLMEADRHLPRIEDLTARTVIVRAAADCDRAIELLGSPVFVKGLIKSRKERGWEACLARTPEELDVMLERSARFPVSERGVLIARELLPLRRSGATVMGFPVSREYRVFLLDGEVIGFGFYWKGQDLFGTLATEEERAMLELSRRAARRVAARLAAVDVGQLEDGGWRVIELGDPQFSGIAHMPHHAFWHALSAASPETPSIAAE